MTHGSSAFSLYSIVHDPRSKFLFPSLVVLSGPFSISLSSILSLSLLSFSPDLEVTVLPRSGGRRAGEQHRAGQPGWRPPSRQAVGLLSSFSLSPL
jgi:hypothetical protein